MENMSGDKAIEIKDTTSNSYLNEEADASKNGALEIIKKLEEALHSVKEMRESYIIEKEVWNKERADEIKEIRESYRADKEAWKIEREAEIERQRELLKGYEDLRKQIQLWCEKNRNNRPSSLTTSLRPPQVVSSEIRIGYFDPSEVFLSENSEEEPMENNEDEELDLGDIWDVDDEADENNEEEQEMEYPEPSDEDENMEHVLEYTPVVSAEELGSPSVIEERKRKATLLLEDDTNKRMKLTLVECPVCQDVLPEMTKAGKVLMVATCGHVLCSNCAMRIWIQKLKRCPKCAKMYDIRNLLPVYL